MKKVLVNFSWFALVLMIAFACTKIGKNITVKGRVINPVNNEPIAGITVFLFKNYKYQTIKKTVSDENGYFELNAAHIGPVWAQVNYEDYHQYYNLGWNVDGNYYLSKKVDKGKVMHVDYHLVPYGELQINIKNTSCFDQNDKLSIFRTHSISGFYDNVPNPAIYTGCIDQQGNLNQAPMGWYKYNGTVTKNGVETTIRDSVYLDAGTTKIWNIYY